MFTIKGLFATAAAAALLTGTTATAAAPPSLATPARAPTTIAHDSDFADVSGATLINIGILAALVVVVLLVVDDNNSSGTPTSP